MTRPRIYVAGAYSADNILDVLSNMRRGIKLTLKVIKAGFAPFCPWLDFQYGLMEELTLADYQNMSMAWLEVSEAVLVVPEGAALSRGTRAEIKRAKVLSIPVFNSFFDLQVWADKKYLPNYGTPERKECKHDIS